MTDAAREAAEARAERAEKALAQVPVRYRPHSPAPAAHTKEEWAKIAAASYERAKDLPDD